MSPEAQRIAIAESVGWKFKDTNVRPFGADFPTRQWHSPDGKPSNFIPDFLHDLNAMHEAEKALAGPTDDEESQRSKYSENLLFVIGGHQEPVDVWYWEHITATAAQRAEAYLRTLNLWTND